MKVLENKYTSMTKHVEGMDNNVHNDKNFERMATVRVNIENIDEENDVNSPKIKSSISRYKLTGKGKCKINRKKDDKEDIYRIVMENKIRGYR